MREREAEVGLGKEVFFTQRLQSSDAQSSIQTADGRAQSECSFIFQTGRRRARDDREEHVRVVAHADTVHNHIHVQRFTPQAPKAPEALCTAAAGRGL